MKIRKYRTEDAEKVAKIIRDTFRKFNSKEGSKKAIETYIGGYDPKKEGIEEIKKEFGENPIFFVAIINGKIVGMIRGTKKRIVNLYLLGKFHGMGIGKNLMQRFEKECKREKSKEIKVKSSLYAVPFYQRMGYKKVTGIKIGFKTIRGLKYQPMAKKLK